MDKLLRLRVILLWSKPQQQRTPSCFLYPARSSYSYNRHAQESKTTVIHTTLTPPASTSLSSQRSHHLIFRQTISSYATVTTTTTRPSVNTDTNTTSAVIANVEGVSIRQTPPPPHVFPTSSYRFLRSSNSINKRPFSCCKVKDGDFELELTTRQNQKAKETPSQFLNCCQSRLFKFRREGVTYSVTSTHILSNCKLTKSFHSFPSTGASARSLHLNLNSDLKMKATLRQEILASSLAKSSTSATTINDGNGRHLRPSAGSIRDGAACGGSGGSGGSVSLPACESAMMHTAKDIFKSAVNSVLPKEMVAKHLILNADGNAMTVAGTTYRLHRNVHVVGFGKAVLGMARAVDNLIGPHVVKGVVSVPQGTGEEFRNAGKTDMLLEPGSAIRVREGAANNMPDVSAHQAALEIADLATSLGDGDLLLVLISGGGSALLPAPAPPITLSDMLEVTGQMSRGGATIGQLNTVRKQLDFLKGGGLAALASPAPVVSLILSDIVGDPVDLIASAPTVPDSSTPQDCLAIFSQLNIVDVIPKTVTDFLTEKSRRCGVDIGRDTTTNGSTSRSTSPLPLLGNNKAPSAVEDLLVLDPSHRHNVQNVIIGSNKIACERACVESKALGFNPFVLTTELEGEAREVGRMFARLAAVIVGHLNLLGRSNNGNNNVDNEGIEKIRGVLISRHKLSVHQLDEIVSHVEKSKMAAAFQGVCIVAGGETTVNVTGTGKGGRNQEMATSAGLELDKVFKENNLHIPSTNAINSNATDSQLSSVVEKQKHSGSSLTSSNTITPQIVFLSAGTDGQDGPTTAAGGVVGLNFVESAVSADLNPVGYLDNNDCFSLLERWAEGVGLVRTGLTGTNVMDVQLLIVKTHDSL